jgi:hypothetical protein
MIFFAITLFFLKRKETKVGKSLRNNGREIAFSAGEFWC